MFLFNNNSSSNCKNLKSGRILLRQLKHDDLEAIMAYATDPEATKWLSIGVQTEEQVVQWLIGCLKSNCNPSNTLYWAICLKDTEECIGCIEVSIHKEGPTEDFCGVIGYASSSDYWGKGYMPEAAKLVVDFIFLNFSEVCKLKIPVYAPNVASQKVAEKLGFTMTSLLSNEIEKNGEWLDVHIFTLSKEVWLEKQKELKTLGQ